MTLPGAPSAAAAAGAAAAALLQRQLLQESGGITEVGWTEHQTGDGRKFFYHQESGTSTWEKPEALMTPEEKANDTVWREYRIWDGRVFYYNKESKVSCWSMPPDLRKLRGEGTGLDDRPLLPTLAEKRRAYWDLLQAQGIDGAWNWAMADKATRGSPQAAELDEKVRKQIFAELLSLSVKRADIAAREKERNAASALERLIEDRFGRPEDLDATYEDAAKILSGEEAWKLMKSDVRRDEVFQDVMERLEEKHRKARMDRRTERVVRLQRLMATDPVLRRSRLRWKDVAAVLARRDELQEEAPPVEALRVWASLRDLRHASEYEAEAKAKVKPDAVADREDRKRRDAFVICLQELAATGTVTAQTSWAEVEALADSDVRISALREGRGATANELFDEFQEELREKGPAAFFAKVEDPFGLAKEEEIQEPAAKKQRLEAAPQVEPVESAEDNTNALDALIAGLPLDMLDEGQGEDAEDPFAALGQQ